MQRPSQYEYFVEKRRGGKKGHGQGLGMKRDLVGGEWSTPLSLLADGTTAPCPMFLFANRPIELARPFGQVAPKTQKKGEDLRRVTQNNREFVMM
jgi:hypothetical protein